MRRALALVSLAALAVGLAACGSSGTSAVAPPQASARSEATRGDDGYVLTNPKALRLVAQADRETADPSVLDDAIPETDPPDYED